MTIVEITCPVPVDFISELSAKGIILSEVRYLDTCTFVAGVEQKDFAELVRAVSLRGNEVKIRSKNMLHIWWQYVLRRPLLCCGLVLIIALTIFLPSRILFIEVVGNRLIPARDIIACVEKSGVTFGVRRASVRSEQVKNYLLSELPSLQWAGINTYGCLAVISVKERTELLMSEPECGVSSIVAACDGIVSEITVKRGSAVCSVGDAVKKGQMLVSGYTDCGILVKAEQAQGHVYAFTRHDMTAVTLQKGPSRGIKTQQYTRYSLKIGKKLINLYNGSSNFAGIYAKIYDEIYIRLPGGFALPIALVRETQITFGTELLQEQNDCSAWLPVYMDNYIQEHMAEGEILNRTYIGDEKDESNAYFFRYYCHEMIGRQRNEEILQ